MSLTIGAITKFNAAFGGAAPNTVIGDDQVMLSGEISDELNATSLALSDADWDSRNPVDPSSGGGLLYDALHGARINLRNAIGNLQRIAPDSTARIGQLFALVAYTEDFFGENMCSGIPLSRLDENVRPQYGSPLTTVELVQRSAADFDSALAYAGSNATIANMAHVGKGRALLNLGQFSAAAAAVADVPTSFVYNATYVTGTLHNGHYAAGTQNWFTIPDREGTNGLNWRTAGDPRVPLVNRSPGVVGLDGSAIWAFAPYLASNAPIPLATGIEARLIEAEAALEANDPTTWLNPLNALRATVSGLSPLADPGTPDARVDLHFRERAFWMFLTGHRHGDLRRLVRQYGRDAETVFPTGLWRDGIPYGSSTNGAPNTAARNNPNFSGCANRNA
jgi:hypothetical protein